MADPGRTGASPVTLGVGRDGPEVGYYSGGKVPADRSEYELWLRLDPDALAAIPEVREAVERERVRSPQPEDHEAEVEAALADLVRLKDGPRDDAYRAAKDAAWDRARAALDAVRERSPEGDLREAARRLIGVYMAGDDLGPSVNALEAAAGFMQQGQRSPQPEDHEAR